MKDLITESITNQIQSALKAAHGAESTFGAPIDFQGKSIIPVARVTIILNAQSSGGGGGNIENKESASKNEKFGIASMLGGGGSGNADAGIKIEITPIGFISEQNGNPVFNPIGDK